MVSMRLWLATGFREQVEHVVFVLQTDAQHMAAVKWIVVRSAIIYYQWHSAHERQCLDDTTITTAKFPSWGELGTSDRKYIFYYLFFLSNIKLVETPVGILTGRTV
jgi:hypothetical protein